MDKAHLEVWLQTKIARRVNGLSFCAQYSTEKARLVSPTTVHRFRVRLDEDGCIVGPDDPTSAKMKDVPWVKRAPISEANLDHTIQTILHDLTDPTGENTIAIADRVKAAQEYLVLVEATIGTWQKRCPEEELSMPFFAMPVHAPIGVKIYHDYLKERKGKNVEDIKLLVSRFADTIREYMQWFSSRTKDQPHDDVEEALVDIEQEP